MSPSVNGSATEMDQHKRVSQTAILHPNIYSPNPRLSSAQGIYFELEQDGRRILDASGGPAVTCLGHGNSRVLQAMIGQMQKLTFCHSLYWGNPAAESLATFLINSTRGKMAKCVFYSSGSEAIEAAMKLARQFHHSLGQPSRKYFVARQGSFHGTTLASLALTGQENKQRPFGPILPQNVSFVSACHPYRGLRKGESLEAYIKRLAAELEAEILRLGPKNVCAFVAETIGGSGNGCSPPVSGYFSAIRVVCDRYGVLLILDEVMCGMGRTGTIHAWERESVAPDIQVVAKGLGGGYSPISALLMSPRVLGALQTGMTKFFNHGHTYQNLPVACAAALEVQRVIQQDRLLENVERIGEALCAGLKRNLGHHKHVGDIRGRGALWAIEFVQDKENKEPFPPERGIARGVRQRGLTDRYNISLQPYSGTMDGVKGDHVMISPAYNVTMEEVATIVQQTTAVIVDFFEGVAVDSGE